jgi:hypothetical protein
MRKALIAIGCVILWYGTLHIARAAESVLIYADPWEIIHIARDHGSADVTRDTFRDPVIAGKFEDLPYSIDFYDCYLGRECSVILFKTGLVKEAWEDDPPDREDIEEWNRGKLFGRAYLDDENRAVLEHPVVLDAGMPRENLDAAFRRWRDAVEDFADFLDF